MIGKTISHYRVLSELGSGGMGVVYEAEDLRLGRRVAVKMLPEEVASRPDAVERFRREARSASALNHANICTIHEVDEHEGHPFIVMELMMGRTLEHTIGNRPLKTDLILEYAAQIADALDAAHAEKIIHRDIKSSNIFITDRGQAKILDFGLAKLERIAVTAATNSPTASVPHGETRPGVTFGTLLYMSPEQARGEPLDARSDIFSFGVVMYEMATGTLPFQGSSQAVIYNQILEKQPVPPLRLNPALPLRLEEIILKALEKDKSFRYQSAAELRADIKRLRRDSESSQAVATAVAVRKKRHPLIYVVTACAVVAAIALAYFSRRAPAPAAVSSAQQWVQLTNFADSVSSPALSPDGRMLAFIRGPGTFVTPGEIWVKLLPNGESKQLTHDGTEKMGPAFSPDGSQITYTTVDPTFGWNTFSVPVLGGEPQRLLPNAAGLTWIGEHQFLYSEIKHGINMALVTSDESRSKERDLYVPPTSRGMVHRSALSPDGRNVTLVEMDNGGWRPCWLLAFTATGTGKPVGPEKSRCTYVAWSPDGKWMYFSADAGDGNHIWRQKYPDGTPQQITFGPTEQEGIAISPKGDFLITAAGLRESTLWLLEKNGEEKQISSEGYTTAPEFSADGKRLYFLVYQYSAGARGFVSGELYVADLATGQVSRVMPGTLIAEYALSPDNTQLAYSAYDDKGIPHIWLAPLDRSSSPRQLVEEEADQVLFASDKNIYYRVRENGINWIHRYKPDGSHEKLNAPAIYELRAISPDGLWIHAWAPASMTQPVSQVAISTRDGSAITVCDDCNFYWSADNRNMAVVFGTVGGSTLASSMGIAFILPLKPGEDLPNLPPGGWKSPDQVKGYKQKLNELPVAVAPGGSRYAVLRRTQHRNLYQIPLN